MEEIAVSHYEFLKQFPDAETARLYLEERRWHGKPICTACGDHERV